MPSTAAQHVKRRYRVLYTLIFGWAGVSMAMIMMLVQFVQSDRYSEDPLLGVLSLISAASCLISGVYLLIVKKKAMGKVASFFIMMGAISLIYVVYAYLNNEYGDNPAPLGNVEGTRSDND